jgi:ABC-type multidrug transport system fused ATPase/permease subunit
VLLLISVVTEFFTWVNLFIIKFFIDWIENEGGFGEGFLVASVFCITMFFSIFLKIYYYMYANKLAIKINRGISTLLYQKILNLSQKSLAMASTGKLVTLVSAELQTLEKTFWYITYLIASPAMQIASFIYFAYDFHEGSAISFVSLLILMAGFILLALKTSRWRYLEGKYFPKTVSK